jgi:alpha-glucosidase
MMLGANLLVAAVVEPGQAERRVWLPGGGGWVDWRSGRYLQGGRYETLAAPLDGPPPLLAREGCAIPMNFGTIRFSHVEDLRGFQVFPLRGEGEFEATCFEDDGLSQACRDGAHGQWRLRVSCTPSGLHLALSREGLRPPVQERVVLRLPRADTRTLGFTGATLEDEATEGEWRRLTLVLPR